MEITKADFRVRESKDARRVDVHSGVDPISLQADTTRKAKFKAALAAAVAEATSGVYLGDVIVQLRWYIPETKRYTTHVVADIDNVLKPILDAVTGPDGVMIDDNQVQTVQISWADLFDDSIRFHLTLEAAPFENLYVDRTELTFIEFSAARCWPLPAGMEPVAGRWVERILSGLDFRQWALGLGTVESQAMLAMPAQRSFPRARLGKYRVRHYTEFLPPEAD